MILTLTPNPSIDRTVSLAGELVRGAVQRVDAVTSQGGGKGVNISRASVSAGQPTLAVLPAAKDDPFVIELLAAGIDCRPVRPAGDVRVNITITEPDGTTTKLNSPGATVEQVHLDAMCDAAGGARRQRRLGRAGRLAAARRPARSSTPTSYAACAAPSPRSPSTPARHPCVPWSTPSPARPRT